MYYFVLTTKMDNCTVEEKNSANLKEFLASVSSTNWAHTANEKTIDKLFKSALEFEEILIQDEKGLLKELILKNYPSLNLNKLLDLVLEKIIKNHFLNEHLTLYAINKYKLQHSEEEFLKFLDKILFELELRVNTYKLIENFSDVDLDFFVLNKLLCDLLNSSDLRSKIENNLKVQTLTFLKAIKYGEVLNANNLINETIICLEEQTDLRLWFNVMKEDNLSVVLELCEIYSNFFKAVLKFFDKFAEEVESNYDEDLHAQYSHVNLDFEDFVKIIQVFLEQASLKKAIADYLDSKTLTDKNFCFWVDVKACL